MSKNRLAGSPGCDDDVAALFTKLGDGKGRPGYRDFSEATLPPPIAAAARLVRKPAAVDAEPALPHEPEVSPVPAVAASAPVDTPLLQLFRRLAEVGEAIPDDSPLVRLRKQ
ncbi:hypothetical protein STPYR_13021 [uncultured Stenotrophomonas sp.]|uniref:Uncharacterized protein n=1 Tax=uncultured Stenotrophomonas sp. TaxID=165438 RepID=A0A1Y5Q761_9GAMM|nr:hypothetical protein STPYR_13021 [uncultured Stenotrophomonas sp.]